MNNYDVFVLEQNKELISINHSKILKYKIRPAAGILLIVISA